MLSGEREVRLMFKELRTLIDRADILKEGIKEKWEEKFPIRVITETLQELLRDINRFQNLYDVNPKKGVETENIFENITKKLMVITEEEPYKPNLLEEKVGQWLTNTFNFPASEPGERIQTITSGKFKEDPQKDFIELHNGVVSIYHNYFKKYSYSELDVAVINWGNVKTKFLKNWKLTVLAVIFGLIVIVGISALTSLFNALFQ